MSIDFGLLLPIGSGDSQHEFFVQDVESYASALVGHIHGLWMSDHFFWDQQPTHEAWTVISFLAARLTDFHVGTLVLDQAYRNPALLGKMGATLQQLTGGRFILGLGAGWKEDEHVAYGYDFPTSGTRIAQLEEAVIIIKRMWYDESPMTYYGRHYRIQKAYCEPKPDPIPPIIIGGGGRKTLRVTAQHANWWNFSGRTPQLYAEKLVILREHCAYVGRDYSDIRLTWLGKLAIAPTTKTVKDLPEDATLRGTPEQIIEQITPFVQLGVDYFIFEMNQLQDKAIVKLMVEDLLPAIRDLPIDLQTSDLAGNG